MKNPWLKFYPSDWRADPSLRMCSLAARGLWMEMLCLMHEADPRGSLLVGGRGVSEKQLASLAGCTLKETRDLITELEEAGVFSRDTDGTIFSRRIRRDIEKSERDKENGKRGGNPILRAGVNVGVNPPHKAQKPEARSHTELRSEKRARRALSSDVKSEFDGYLAEFNDQFWPAWPHKVGKPDAAKAFLRARRAGATCEAILAGVERYVLDKPPDRPWLNPSTFLNQERWNDAPAPVADGPPERDRGDAMARELEQIYERERHERIGSQTEGHLRNVPGVAGPADERNQDADDDGGFSFGHGELFGLGSGEGMH